MAQQYSNYGASRSGERSPNGYRQNRPRNPQQNEWDEYEQRAYGRSDIWDEPPYEQHFESENRHGREDRSSSYSSGETYGRERSQGGFRGFGPKGYQRSDERLKEAVCERLSDDARLDATEITVTVRDGEVTLEGTVRDRQNRYLAEDLVADCSGVKEIHNNLRAQPRNFIEGSGGASSYRTSSNGGPEKLSSRSGTQQDLSSSPETQDSGSRSSKKL